MDFPQLSHLKITADRLNIEFYENFLPSNQAFEIYDIIEKQFSCNSLLYQKKRSKLVYGDLGLIYEVKFGGYGGRPLKVAQYPTLSWSQLPLLTEIKNNISELTGENYNFCVIQRYPNGQVGINPHRDKEMVKGTQICGLSLGSARQLTMAPPRYIKENPIQLTLRSGSLYILKPPTNDYWTHCIEKDESVTPRISLTFRNLPTRQTPLISLAETCLGCQRLSHSGLENHLLIGTDPKNSEETPFSSNISDGKGATGEICSPETCLNNPTKFPSHLKPQIPLKLKTKIPLKLKP